MLRLFVCLLVFSASALQWRSKEEFSYIQGLDMIYRRTGDDSCSLCSEQSCVQLEDARCNYYIETAKVLKETDDGQGGVDADPDTRGEVDSQLYSLVEHAQEQYQNADCIPLVSHFTDCNKENICLGCKRCNCDAMGKWNCTTVSQCHANPLPKLDHPTFLAVIDSLNHPLHLPWRRLKVTRFFSRFKEFLFEENIASRRKRSANESPETISNPLLSEWLETVPPLSPELKIIKNPNEDNIETDDSEYEGLKIPRDKDEKYLKFISRNLYNPEASEKRYIFSGDSNRLKREIDIKKITLKDLSDWLNDMQPASENNSSFTAESDQVFRHAALTQIKRSTTAKIATAKASTTNPTTETPTPEPNQVLTTTKSDRDIAFDEVLSSIITDNHNYTRRKPMLDAKNTERLFEHDFLNDDENVTFENSYEVPGAMRLDNKEEKPDMETVRSKKFNTEAANELTDTFVNGVTETVIDLLDSARRNDKNDLNIDKDYGDENNINEFNPVNLMKRDVTYALNSNVDIKMVDTTNNTIAINNSIEIKNKSTGIAHNLKETVLDPLYDILTDKNKEITKLITMKENLIAFLRDFNETDLDLKENDTNYNDMEIKGKPEYISKAVNNFVSNNKVNMPHVHDNIEPKNDANILNNYVTKLKNDLFEVIKDIAFVQKLYSNPSEMPDDMKFLIKSMKKYVHRKGYHIKGKKHTLKSRRFLKSEHNNNNFAFIKENILDILNLVDKGISSSNTVESLSPSARKILQRITKQYYVDEFARVGLRISDCKYNITEDLKSVGSKWSKLTKLLETSNNFNRIYNMKLLHLVLSNDISKVKDSLAILDFAGGRRAKLLDNNLNLNTINQMNTDLNILNKEIQDIATKEMNNNRILRNSKNWPKTEVDKRKKRNSFLKKLKTLLSNSKKNISPYVPTKIKNLLKVLRLAKSKTEDVESLSDKNLKSFEKTMLNWQKYLRIAGLHPLRMKRSLSDYNKLSSRIKNIIPKYLRGKVHPAINAKHSKKRTTTISF